MSNLKTSISIVALVAGLTFGFAPQSAFADNEAPQNGGAIAGIGKIKENIDHRDGQLEKMDAEAAARQRNIEKNLVKPQTTAHINTGGQSGFPDTPKVDVKPAEPSLIDKCVSGVCSYIKWTTGWTIGEAIVDVVKEPDEAKEQKDHNERADKAALERMKADDAKKAPEQQKTAEAPKSTQLKMADVKNLENTNSRTLKLPTHTTSAKPMLLETPKVATATVTRAPVTVASHIEVSRPTVNVVRPTINVAQVRVPQPTIRIPTIVIRR